MNRLLILLLVMIISPIQISHNIKRKEIYSISTYKGSILDPKQSRLDRILWSLFFEEHNHIKKYLYYTKKYSLIITILQLVLLIPAFWNRWHLNSLFFVIYLSGLAFLNFLPMLFISIMQSIYDHKSKDYYKQEYKQRYGDKFVLKTKDILYKKNSIYKAIRPYLTMINPKKNRFYVTLEKAKEIEDMLGKNFSYAHMEFVSDLKGKQILKVFVESKSQKELVIEIPILK